MAATGFPEAHGPELCCLFLPVNEDWAKQEFFNDANVQKVKRLKPIADALGITRSQLALAWVLRHPGVSSVITGATRVAQLDENVKAADVTLSADVIAQVRQMQMEIKKLDSESAVSQAILASGGNKPARLQAQFLNTVIARKSFSWTRTFSDLERIMPAQVHLISLEPRFDEANQLEIRMSVGATSHEKATELLKKLEH